MIFLEDGQEIERVTASLIEASIVCLNLMVSFLIFFHQSFVIGIGSPAGV